MANKEIDPFADKQIPETLVTERLVVHRPGRVVIPRYKSREKTPQPDIEAPATPDAEPEPNKGEMEVRIEH